MKALLLIGLMTMVLPAQADVFRCQDAGGKTVYQEAPCEKANLKTIKKLEKPASPTPEAIEKAQADSKAMIQRYNERKKAEQEAAKKGKEEQKTGQPEGAQPERAQPETAQPESAQPVNSGAGEK